MASNTALINSWRSEQLGPAQRSSGQGVKKWCACVFVFQHVVCDLTLTLQVHSHADSVCKGTNEVLLCSASVSVRNVVGCWECLPFCKEKDATYTATLICYWKCHIVLTTAVNRWGMLSCVCVCVLTLVEENRKELQQMLDALNRACTRWGWRISGDKTKALSNGQSPQDNPTSTLKGLLLEFHYHVRSLNYKDIKIVHNQ